MHLMEEGPKEVCLIETILEEQAEQQQQQHDVLIEELSDLSEELQETQEMWAVHGPWRKKKRKKSCLFLLRKTRKKKEPVSLKIITSSLDLWN